MLIAEKVKIDMQANEMTAFHMTVIRGYVECAGILLVAGANINTRSCLGVSIVTSACNSSLEVCFMFLILYLCFVTEFILDCENDSIKAL